MDERNRPDKQMTAVSRPRMPASYGIKGAGEGHGLLAWGHVVARMQAARNYWVITASADGRPHAAPVWGVWLDGAFYFSTDPESRKGRNLAANPLVVIPLESGDDAVILEGIATRFKDQGLMAELDRAYFDKYSYRLMGNSVYRVQPSKVFAWSEADFPEIATRWRPPI